MTETDTMNVDPEVVEGEVVDDTATEEVSSPAAKSNGRGKKGKAAEAETPGTEVEKAADPEPPAEGADDGQGGFTKAQARRLTAKLKGNLRSSAELIMEAYDGRIWIPLEYESWEDYLNSELGEYRIKLPAVERKELVAKMSAAKRDGGSAMSSRAIASALGVDQKTVVNDRKELGLVKVDSERADEKVIGLDGREQTASRPSAPRVVNLVDKFTTHFVPMSANLDELLVLTTDERWEDEAAEVAKRHRADLTRAARTLSEIFKALPGNGEG